MSVIIQTGNVVKIQSGNRVLISAPGPQGPPGSGGSPGGSDTQVQFNDGGVFGGDAALTFNKTTGVLSATHIHGALAGNLYVHVKNTSGGTLAKGTPVYATGSVGVSGIIEVAAADYTNAAKMPAIGIIDTELTANAEGNAVVVGEITGLATNGYSINQELFVGTSGLLGSLPISGQAQSIAVVSRVHASTGIIVVNAQARLNTALRALANDDGSSLTGITASQVGAVANGDSPTFADVTLTKGTIATGTSTLDYTHVGTQGDVPYFRVNLNDGATDIGQTLIGFRGDGAGGGTSFVQASTTDLRIEQSGGSLADVYGGSFIGSGASLTALNANNITIGTLATARLPTVPVANGGTGATTLTANAVLLGNGTSAPQTVAPSTSGNVLTSNGTTWTSAAPAGATYATDLQARQGLSTSTAIAPATLWSALHDSLFTADFSRLVSSAGTGSGTMVTTGSQPYPSTGATAKSTARGYWITQAKSGTSTWGNMDFSRPSSFGLTVMRGSGTVSSTGIFRVWFGTDTSASSIAARGYGFEIREYRVWIIAHDGTTLVTQDTGTDISSTSFVMNVMRCVNDGAGNISLFMNNAQIGTALAGGPTTAGTSTLNILNLNGATATANDIRTVAGTFSANVY